MFEMELKDTQALMNSDNYAERFKAEYWQTKIRYQKLLHTCVKYMAGTLTPIPKCSLQLLEDQKSLMGRYLCCLEVRAELEGINLYDVRKGEEQC